MTVNDALRPGRRVVGAAGGIALGTARTWLGAVSWGARASRTAASRLTVAVSDREAALGLVHDASSSFRRTARDLLGIADLDERTQTDTASGGNEPVADGAASERDLRGRGAELLRESADVDVEEEAHPAYARILKELAPDEARILRLLKAEGPQPAVDVCAANLLGAASELIAPNLTMLGPEAGCRHKDRVATYVNNLERLGLIQFLDSPLEDLARYQVLEAQPDVLGTIQHTTRAKPIHRSVHLTPFGEGFCEVCVPLDTMRIEGSPRTDYKSE